MTTIQFLNPEQAIRCLAVAHVAGVATQFVGGPGSAKTAIHKQYAAMIGAPFYGIPVGQHDIGDFFLPVISHEKKSVVFYATDRIPWDVDAPAVLLFDDAHKAAPSMQPLLMNVMWDRLFHGRALSEKVMVSSTGNSTSDINNSEMCEALITRMCTLFMSLHAPGSQEAWEAWAQQSGLAVETMLYRKSFVQEMAKHDDKLAELAVFNDRTLELADKLWRSMPSAPCRTDDIRMAMLAGCLGMAHAVQYEATARLVTEAPPMSEIIAHPDKAKLPDNPSVVYALSLQCVRAADKATATPIARYATRLAPAFGQLIIKSVKDKAGCNVCLLDRDVQKWISEHADLLTA